MQDLEFSVAADKALSLIADAIETADRGGLIDIDFQDGIITISTDKGTFVINKHSAAKEIWLASPISGPYHFGYMQGKWRSKTGIDLFEILTKEFKTPIHD